MAFNAGLLPVNMAAWHTRLIDVINDVYGSKYPDPDAAAASGDLYQIGRTVVQYCQSLRCAYRVVGDPALLAECVRVMTIAYGSLADYDGDGLLEWFDFEAETDALMDRDNGYAQVAMHTLWLASHQADYPTEYAAWMDLVDNHVLVHKLYHDNLMHIDSRHLMYMYAMETLGKVIPHNLRDWIDTNFMPQMLTDGNGAFVWDHRRMLPGPALELGSQPSVYATGETAGSFIELYLCNVSPFCGDSFMEKWAKTWSVNVLPSMVGSGQTAPDVNGGENFSWIEARRDDWKMDTERYCKFACPAYTPWDTTGRLTQWNDWSWSLGGVSRRTPILPAYTLVGEGIKYINDNAGSTPWK